MNRDERRTPVACVLPDVVAAQALRTPDALAITGHDGPDISYRSLLAWVGQFAVILAARGVRPGDLVGLCLARGPELVVAALAVTRLGGGYVPLDPGDPARRLTMLAEDAGLRTVVVNDTEHCPIMGIDLVVVSTQGTTTAPAMPSPCPVSPQDTAYMIYTSGSTGIPKGVPTSHAAVVELLHWMTRTYPLDESRRVLMKTSPSFDVSIAEMFWPLMSGAALVVPHRDGHRDPAHLAEVIQRFAVTDVFFVPSQLTVFFAEPAAAHCRTLRRLISAGEELPPATLRQIFDTLPDVQVINAYGPTEAAVLALWHDCVPRDTHASRVPIGRPIGRTRAEVVDPHTLAPVPVGTPGELILAGPQVARGYHRRADLTAARFLRTPAGQVRYRTGDTARVREGGVVEFLGREDRQVKIRGHRVELGEVEAVLRDGPHVQDARAGVRPDPVDQVATLVAWVVTDDSTVTDTELRTHLRDRVPDYLTPSRIVRLPRFPLLSNGKLDNPALPDPFTVTGLSPARNTGPVPDTRPLAQVIAETWRQLTGAHQVKPGDGFIASGGSSLLLLRLRGHLRTLGYPHVRVLDLLTHPTPIALAEFLTAPPNERRTR